MNEGTDQMDDFQKRLEDSLKSARRRQETALQTLDRPPAAGDGFEERLRRAAETAGKGPSAGVAYAGANPAASGSLRLDGFPPDLRTVVERWPQLTGSVRAYIVNMARANREPQAV